MNYKFIKYLGIKCFPSNLLDYLGHCIFNFFFSLVIIINIPFLNNILFHEHKTSYILLVPKISNNFEEKKDLIFSGLSLNTNIISVREVEKKIILEKLKKKIELIDEDLVPEVFEVTLKKNKKLDLEKENKKVDEVLQGAQILDKKIDYHKYNSDNYFLLGFSVFLFLSILVVLQIDFVKKLKVFLEKSRNFGAKDRDLLYNISLGYLLFQFLGIFSAYFSFNFFESNFKKPSIFTVENYETIIIFIFLQNMICYLNLIFTLRYTLRRIF